MKSIGVVEDGFIVRGPSVGCACPRQLGSWLAKTKDAVSTHRIPEGKVKHTNIRDIQKKIPKPQLGCEDRSQLSSQPRTAALVDALLNRNLQASRFLSDLKTLESKTVRKCRLADPVIDRSGISGPEACLGGC